VKQHETAGPAKPVTVSATLSEAAPPIEWTDGKPTHYRCAACGQVHSSHEAGCLSVLVVTTPTMLPTLPAGQPVQRRHVCGVCPRELQPASGFPIAEFVEHSQAHAATAVRELVQDADRCRHALKTIEHFLRSP